MTETPTVDQAWSNAMEDLRVVAKSEFNQQQQFNFRGVDAVVNATGPVFRTHRLKVIPKTIRQITSTEYETRARGDRPGTRMVNKEVIVTWEVRGPAGDTFTGETAGEAADAGDKALSKAQSVAYRVFLLQSLNLPTHERDPDADTHERASQTSQDVDPAIAAAIEAADQARGELLEKTSAYGWDEPKLVRRYWDDYSKNLRNTHDVDMIRAFGDALVDEAKAQDAAEDKPAETLL